MGKTSIEWTDETWNPVTGCTHVSEGCRFCYAERLMPRLKQDFSEIRLHPDRLDAPLHWKKPRRVFVNSMSDLFHEDIPDSFIADVFYRMIHAPQHTYQILTKRPLRMLAWVKTNYLNYCTNPGWQSIWLGVSVEDQKTAEERIPILLQTPAAIRFVSAEPLLSPITTSITWWPCLIGDGPDRQEEGIDWFIIGGESGPQARVCALDWIRRLRDQAQSAGVPVFIKQLGANVATQYDRGEMRRTERGFESVSFMVPLSSSSPIRDRKGGDWNEWPEDLKIREYPRKEL